MSSARDIINGALRLIGAYASGETPSSDVQADALSSLNDVLDSWSTEKLLVFERIKEKFDLVGGTSQYTIGTGGTFNTSRPQKYENAAIEVQTTTPYEIPIAILNQDQYAAIKLKGTQSTFPMAMYSEGSYPLDKIDVWPVPTDANKLVLYTWKPFTAFANASTSVSFPPGYKRALRYNLAIELAPEYGKTASQDVVAIATDSKANIKRMNIQPAYLQCDAAVVGRQKSFNWMTGE